MYVHIITHTHTNNVLIIIIKKVSDSFVARPSLKKRGVMYKKREKKYIYAMFCKKKK